MTATALEPFARLSATTPVAEVAPATHPSATLRVVPDPQPSPATPSVDPIAERDARIAASLVAGRMERISGLPWAGPATQDALAALARDLTPGGMPLARLLNVIHCAVEADRSERGSSTE